MPAGAGGLQALPAAGAGRPDAAEAEDHLGSLEQRCGGVEAGGFAQPASPSPTTAPRPCSSTPRRDAPEDRSARRAAPLVRRDKLAAALLGAGVTVGVAAGLVYLWNDDRYDRWRAEDQRLSAPPAGSPVEWLDRQRQNDDLLRSIQRVDTMDKVLAGAAVISILGSAVLGVVLNRSQTIEPRPGGLAVTWRWP